MDNIKELAAITALNHMFSQGYLSICTIDSVAKMLGVNPKGNAYNILHTLHCVGFEKIPAELKEKLPDLIRECLSLSTVYEFEHVRKQKVIVSQTPIGKLLSYVKG